MATEVRFSLTSTIHIQREQHYPHLFNTTYIITEAHHTKRSFMRCSSTNESLFYNAVF